MEMGLDDNRQTPAEHASTGRLVDYPTRVRLPSGTESGPRG